MAAAETGNDRTESILRGVAAVIGVMTLGFGLWAFFDPRSFFDAVATFEPFNEHFLRDIGAFQIGTGVVLLLGALWPRDALTVVLLGGGIGAVVHAISHVIDGDVDPASWVIAIVLVGAGVVALRRDRRPSG